MSFVDFTAREKAQLKKVYRNMGQQNSYGRQSSTYGTEEDPINCAFYLRVGACRHHVNCPKNHPIPAFSQTIMLEHLWIVPKTVLKNKRKKMEHYENFYEDVLQECLKYGGVQDLLVQENMGDHMIGNVFVRFVDEESAELACKSFKGRFYAGRKVHVQFSPVHDFAQGRCKDYATKKCLRGDYCNFAHFMPSVRWAQKHFTRPDHNRRRQRRYRSQRETGVFPVNGSTSERRRCIAKWNKDREASGKLKTFDTPEINGSTNGLKLYQPKH